MEPDRPKAADKDGAAWAAHLRQAPEAVVSVPVADIRPDMSQGSHAIKDDAPNAGRL